MQNSECCFYLCIGTGILCLFVASCSNVDLSFNFSKTFFFWQNSWLKCSSIESLPYQGLRLEEGVNRLEQASRLRVFLTSRINKTSRVMFCLGGLAGLCALFWHSARFWFFKDEVLLAHGGDSTDSRSTLNWLMAQAAQNFFFLMLS